MSFVSEVDFWRHASILVGGIGQTTFLILYLRIIDWRLEQARALFTMAFALALLTDTASVGAWLDWPGEDTTIVALYWVVAVAIYVQLITFVIQRVKYRREHHR